MILACIDGGLFCGPIALGIYGFSALGIGAWAKRKVCGCKKSQAFTPPEIKNPVGTIHGIPKKGDGR